MVFHDHRGMAWTIPPPPFEIKELWVSSMKKGVVKGWHGDQVTTRMLVCLQGDIWQNKMDGHARRLVPGGEAVLILPNEWSAVVALEPSLLLYLQDQPVEKTAPITKIIDDREDEDFPACTDWTSLSLRDRGLV